ncbi:hypothetical protein GQ53DRAFT_840774 [Thozetella sp. PMI_491]|nr:hypothetical protein GQ53DRAFT_840774 [Thozetella sp. PMI_491]
MKEHLYRRHRQPRYQCKRCGEPFQDEVDLNGHLRAAKPCNLREMPPLDGFDSKQEGELKSRKRVITGLSEVEKWKHTYRILFPLVPETEIPSPYYEYTDPRRDSLSKYEEYSIRKMKGSLGPALEQEVAAGSDNTGAISPGKLVDIFLKYQRLCLLDFRNEHQEQLASPAFTGDSQTIETVDSGCRGTPETETAEALECLSSPNDQHFFSGPMDYDHMDSFDLDLYSFPYETVEVIIEQSLDESTTRPTDSGYSSLSTKPSSECHAQSPDRVAMAHYDK